MRDSQAQDAVREGPVAGGGGCVLVVDDSESFVALLDAFLSSEAGCRVASCGGGREALELARRLQPAVILLDIVLPDLQGHEVCRQLAEHPETAGIPVILMRGCRRATVGRRGGTWCVFLRSHFRWERWWSRYGVFWRGLRGRREWRSGVVSPADGRCVRSARGKH